MPENHSNDHPLDDRLAEFTDQILSGDSSNNMQLSEDEDLRRLQEVVLKIKRAGTLSEPPPSFDTRLRNMLRLEWKQSGTNHVPNPRQPMAPNRSLWESIKAFFQVAPKNRAWQFALAAAAVLLIALLVLPIGSAGLTGAAGMSAPMSPIVLGIGILCVVFLFWLWRRKE